MKYGWITTNITDLLAKPEFNSERLNQLLLADLVMIKNEAKGYCKISKAEDGYTGYCKGRFIKPLLKKEYLAYIKAKKYFIKAMTANIYDKNMSRIMPYYLFYGTLVKAKQSNNKMKLSLPDGSSLFLSSAHLTPMNISKPISSGAALINEAKRFLGAPYLWGGISTPGIDCSGLVQTVCRRFGIEIPRDTKDQIKTGFKISRNEIKSGDLLFFKRHVAMAIDSNQFIHSSVGGGGVRINSLESSDENYRDDLEQTFEQARRIL